MTEAYRRSLHNKTGESPSSFRALELAQHERICICRHPSPNLTLVHS